MPPVRQQFKLNMTISSSPVFKPQIINTNNHNHNHNNNALLRVARPNMNFGLGGGGAGMINRLQFAKAGCSACGH